MVVFLKEKASFQGANLTLALFETLTNSFTELIQNEDNTCGVHCARYLDPHCVISSSIIILRSGNYYLRFYKKESGTQSD